MYNNNDFPMSKIPKKYVITEKIEKSEVDHSSPLSTSNAADMNRGLTLAFLQVLLKYGKWSSGFSYGLEGFISVQGKLQYYVKKHRIQSILSRIMYAGLCAHLLFGVINFDFSVSNSKLVNWIKRITHYVFIVKLVVIYICLEKESRGDSIWIKILEHVDIIQEKFANSGISAPSRIKVKIFGVLLCVLSFVLCVTQILVFSLSNGSNWHVNHARKIAATLSFNFWKLDIASSNPTMVRILGYLGFLFEIFAWNLWYVSDALRLFFSLIVWFVFRRINSGLASGQLAIHNLPDIIDLHLKGVKLLHLLNQLISPITFVSTLFNLLYTSFWTNFLLISFEFKVVHVIGIITVIRMVTLFYITADVNTQACQISTWLEDRFSETGTAPKVDKLKFTLFTSLIYNRDVIGFKGLNFFTITPALNSAIAGFVLTYTVVVNQLVTH